MTHRGQSHPALAALLALTFTAASAAADNGGARGKSEVPGKSAASAKSKASESGASQKKAAPPEGAKGRGASVARNAPGNSARESRESGTLSKDDSKKSAQELKQGRKERSQRQRAALKERWGARLSEPAIRAELLHHARRMAQLERMALLVETERQGADRDELLARIEKLTRLENERHERKMKRLEEPTSTQLVKE